jgi:hypothetical protein
MKRGKTTKTLALALTALFSCSAQAVIIDHGDYLSDTVSGLDWKDVTATVNMSYNDVSAQFGTNGAYAGWRYATGDEFNVLVGNYTGDFIIPGVYYTIFQFGDRIDGLVALIGSTLDTFWQSQYGTDFDSYQGYTGGPFMDYSYGLLADQNQSGLRYAAFMQSDNRPNGSDMSGAHSYTVPDDYAGYLQGSFLVRSSASAIPEPTTIALLALGLMGLAVAKGRSGR